MGRIGRSASPVVRPGRAFGAAALLALTLLAAGSDVALANSLTAPTITPNPPQAGRPATITITGAATAPSTLRVFVEPSGAGCAGGGNGPANAEAQAQRIGSVEVISRIPTGPFAYSAQYTPPTAGNYSLCAYLFGPTAATGASQVSSNFSVAPAPAIITPAPIRPAPPLAPGAVAPTRCVVPQLKGRTYLGARKLLARHGCATGTVYRPTRSTPKGKVLRVVWQLPASKSVRKLHSRVTLRLGFVPRPRSS